MEMLLMLFVCAAIALLLNAVFRSWRLARADIYADRSVDEAHALTVLDALVEERHRILAQMRTLGLDRDTAKIDDAEYKRSYRQLERQMFRILKQLQTIRGSDEDLDEADEALDKAFETVAAKQNTEGWSAAALARHGGQLPSEVQL